MTATRRAFMAAVAGTAWEVPSDWRKTGDLAPRKFGDPGLERLRLDVDGWLLCSFDGLLVHECRNSAGMIKSSVMVFFCHPRFDYLRGAEISIDQIRSAGMRTPAQIRELFGDHEIREMRSIS